MDLLDLLTQKIGAKDWLSASHILETIVLMRPADHHLLLELAKIYITLKDLHYRAKARSCLERYIAAADPINPVAIELLAIMVYHATGPIEKMRPLLDKYGALLEPDRLQGFYALAGEHEEYRATIRKIGTERIGRLPSQINELGNLRNSIGNFVLSDIEPRPILKDAAIFTFGSCFANNVARALKARNFDVDNFWVGEEVNTTFSNLNLVRFILGKEVPYSDYYSQVMAEKPIPRLAESLRRADAIIYTMGVAPAFFERDSSRYIPHSTRNIRTLTASQDIEYRFSTVDENVSSLTELLGFLRENTNVRHLFITVSPVPLASSIGFRSTICADTESKSILRAAAGMFARRFEDSVIYFPSFEVFRWLPCFQSSSAFGGDDDTVRHPNEGYVTQVVESFIGCFA